MSANAPDHYVREFSRNVKLLLQQQGSKLRKHVMEGSHSGEQASPVDQIGAVVAQKVTTRFGPIGRVDPNLERRWVYPQPYHIPQYIDTFDKLKQIIDVTSSYVKNGVFALGRSIDDEIISAFFGDAKTGVQGGDTTSFLSANQVAVNFTGNGVTPANTGLTVVKLAAAYKKLMANEVDMDMERPVCVITAQQDEDLKSQTQIVSADFNNKMVLVDGKVSSFMGFDFVHCERLPVDSSGNRRIPVFVKSGMHLGVWDDLYTSVKPDITLAGHPWQVYAKITIGATRTEEKRIVEIKCDEP